MVIPQLIITQYIVTALSSGFNACYFFKYRSSVKRRRIGAVVLALISIAIFTESVYFSFFALFQRQQWAGAFFLEPNYWLIARLLLCFGSLVISGLILRQLVANRK